MRTIKNFDEALKYVNRLGIVSPYKPIGWRQQDLCKIVEILEDASLRSKGFKKIMRCPYLFGVKYPVKSNAYPMKVHFNKKRSRYKKLLIFTVNKNLCTAFAYPKA